MSSSKRVAVVTGSNKGIGYETVRALCKEFDGDVILTARNEQLGLEAVKKLNTEGLKPVFHQLDICDKASIATLRDFIQNTYGGLEILVNNAAMAFKSTAPEPFDVQAEVSMKTNFWATLDVCDALYPLLRPHARVAHVGSFVSAMSARKCSEDLNTRFLDEKMDVETVKTLMTEFVKAAKSGDVKAKGWADSAYGTSKIGIYLLTVAQQKIFNKDSREDLIVNCCCPGSVQTDMSSQRGHLTPEQGADCPTYASLLPANCSNPKGEFLSKRKVYQWPGNIGKDDYFK